MKPSSLILSLLLLLLLHHRLPIARAITPEDACTAAAAHTQPFNYQLCVDSLKSDPLGGSGNTNLEDLTSAAVQQSLLKDQAAWNQAVAIRQRFQDVGPILDKCASLYKGLQDTIQQAGFLLQNELKVPARKAARQLLVEAQDGSRQCPDAFSSAGKESPIAIESSNVTDMLQISVGMLDILPPPLV